MVQRSSLNEVLLYNIISFALAHRQLYNQGNINKFEHTCIMPNWLYLDSGIL